jgi:hypothetical protein
MNKYDVKDPDNYLLLSAIHSVCLKQVTGEKHFFAIEGLEEYSLENNEWFKITTDDGLYNVLNIDVKLARLQRNYLYAYKVIGTSHLLYLNRKYAFDMLGLIPEITEGQNKSYICIDIHEEIKSYPEALLYILQKRYAHEITKMAIQKDIAIDYSYPIKDICKRIENFQIKETMKSFFKDITQAFLNADFIRLEQAITFFESKHMYIPYSQLKEVQQIIKEIIRIAYGLHFKLNCLELAAMFSEYEYIELSVAINFLRSVNGRQYIIDLDNPQKFIEIHQEV